MASEDELLSKSEALAKRALVYDTRLTSEDVPALANEDQATASLQEDCEQLWQELQGVHRELSSIQGSVVASDHRAHAVVTTTKEKLLQAEIDVLREERPRILPKDVSVQQMVLADSLQRSLSQLQQTLSMLRTEHKTLFKDMEREETEQREHQQVQRVLQHKIEQLDGQQQQGNQREKNLMKEVEHKKSALTSYHTRLMKQMGQFIQKHFPPPDAAPKTKGKNSSLQRQREYTPLIKILEELMNRSLDCPHDPYIDLDDLHWAPYLELLLRVGIARRHPQNINKLKLTPFHQ